MRHASTSHISFQDKFTIARYKDQGKWVAHNLSLDIVGVGKTKQGALKELQQLTASQLQFALQHRMLDAINHPAPDRFWKMVAEKINANVISKLSSHFSKFESNDINELTTKSQVYDITPPNRLAQAG